MQTSQNTSNLHWYDRPWAAFMFFTRLPLWRLHQPPQEAYRSVVEWWPLVGWLTGGVMAGVLYVGSIFLPYTIAVLLAIVSRMLLTGALHEDGLADFFDGFGGGTSRERILAIMKDSHIGTYGTLSLIMYMALLFLAICSLSPQYAPFFILAADPYAKMLSAQAVQMLPYARDEQTAKSGVVYRKYGLLSGIGLTFQGLLPLTLIALIILNSPLLLEGVGGRPHSSSFILHSSFLYVPALVMYFLYRYIWRRLRGYTGDCCGALFQLIELSFYLTAVFNTAVFGFAN